MIVTHASKQHISHNINKHGSPCNTITRWHVYFYNNTIIHLRRCSARFSLRLRVGVYYGYNRNVISLTYWRKQIILFMSQLYIYACCVKLKAFVFMWKLRIPVIKTNVRLNHKGTIMLFSYQERLRCAVAMGVIIRLHDYLPSSRHGNRLLRSNLSSCFVEVVYYYVISTLHHSQYRIMF